MNNSGLAQPLAVTEGGTGGKTSAAAKVNLGLGTLSVGGQLTWQTGGGYTGALNISTISADTSWYFPNVESNVACVVTKTTTGDPTVPEGVFVINTFDNNFKIMADGALRSLATW